MIQGSVGRPAGKGQRWPVGWLRNGGALVMGCAVAAAILAHHYGQSVVGLGHGSAPSGTVPAATAREDPARSQAQSPPAAAVDQARTSLASAAIRPGMAECGSVLDDARRAEVERFLRQVHGRGLSLLSLQRHRDWLLFCLADAEAREGLRVWVQDLVGTSPDDPRLPWLLQFLQKHRAVMGYDLAKQVVYRAVNEHRWQLLANAMPFVIGAYTEEDPELVSRVVEVVLRQMDPRMFTELVRELPSGQGSQLAQALSREERQLFTQRILTYSSGNLGLDALGIQALQESGALDQEQATDALSALLTQSESQQERIWAAEQLAEIWVRGARGHGPPTNDAELGERLLAVRQVVETTESLLTDADPFVRCGGVSMYRRFIEPILPVLEKLQ